MNCATVNVDRTSATSQTPDWRVRTSYNVQIDNSKTVECAAFFPPLSLANYPIINPPPADKEVNLYGPETSDARLWLPCLWCHHRHRQRMIEWTIKWAQEDSTQHTHKKPTIDSDEIVQ